MTHHSRLVAVGNHSAWDYWSESRRPLVSLVFVAPMLAAYEGGLLMFGPAAMRNGADAWLRAWLESLGFGQYFLLPLLTCGTLLAWHHMSRERWRVDGTTLLGMVVESLVIGIMLLGIAHCERVALAKVESAGYSLLAVPRSGTSAGQFLPFLGAGIYEELLFRLLLLPALAAVCRFAGGTRLASMAAAILGGSLLFAAAHYQIDIHVGLARFVTSHGDMFDGSTFLFRLSAGLLFSLLFLYRGFGIAAGSHALYDILVAT